MAVAGIPETIGAYRIQREIGRGAMGVVYLARDTRLDRDVAIKALPVEFTNDAARLARFEREAKVLASLNHPNIGAIYALEEDERGRYLILELVEGGMLDEVVRKGAMSPEQALGLCRQIACALEAAHDKGVLSGHELCGSPEGARRTQAFARRHEAADTHGCRRLWKDPVVPASLQVLFEAPMKKITNTTRRGGAPRSGRGPGRSS